MRQLSEQTNRLIVELQGIKSTVSWFGLGKADKDNTVAQLLVKIAEQYELGTVEVFASYLFEDSQVIRKAASQAIDMVFSNAKPTELFQMLENSFCIYSNEWRILKPRQITGIISDEKSLSSVLGLLSFHSNGFVRHEAVRRLGKINDCRELMYLLIRLNDWVQPIRENARSLVSERLTDKYIPELFRCLGIIVRLLECHRDDHHPTVKKVVELLQDPKHHAELKAAISYPDSLVRRMIYEVAFDCCTVNDRMITLGLSSSDPAIRLKASKKVAHAVSGPELRQIAHRLQQDTFMPVRREGYLIEADAFPEELDQIWLRGLLDRNASIRDYARFYLKKKNTVSVSDYYRKLAGDPCLRVEVAHGLGETGDERDLPLIRRLLTDSSSPRLTSALIRSLSAIAKEAAIPDLLHCLNDSRPSVVRETCLQLKRYGRSIPPVTLYNAIVNSHSTQIRNAMLPLFVQLGKWTSLPWLIRLLNHSDESVEQISGRMIAAWFTPPLCNRIFTKPTMIESEQIQEAIRSLRFQNNLPLLRQLDLWLKES